MLNVVKHCMDHVQITLLFASSSVVKLKSLVEGHVSIFLAGEALVSTGSWVVKISYCPHSGKTRLALGAYLRLI